MIDPEVIAMNHEKTGALIAKRRMELGLTQKALAEQLNISDRTVSKWERGLGFPDISLIEPLADALGLTVLELLHGEEEPPTPEEERSARETLNNIRPEVHEKMKKKHRWIIVLAAVAVLLAAALAVVLGLAVNAERDWHMEDCPATDATAASEYALITQNEFALMETLWQDERVVSLREAYKAYKETVDEYPIAVPEMDEEFCEEYFRAFILPVRNLDYYRIYVSDTSISVQYGTELTDTWLSVGREEAVHKQVTEFEVSWLNETGVPVYEERNVFARVESFDNETFRVSVFETGLAALFNGI